MIVGFSKVVVQLETHPADFENEIVPVHAIGIPEFIRKHGSRQIELPLIDPCIVAGRHCITSKSLPHIFVRKDFRQWQSFGFCFCIESQYAKYVIDMSVRVHGRAHMRVNGQRRQFPLTSSTSSAIKTWASGMALLMIGMALLTSYETGFVTQGRPETAERCL